MLSITLLVIMFVQEFGSVLVDSSSQFNANIAFIQLPRVPRLCTYSTFANNGKWLRNDIKSKSWRHENRQCVSDSSKGMTAHLRRYVDDLEELDRLAGLSFQDFQDLVSKNPRDIVKSSQVVTYSRKVFIPLTRLCRDKCHYCT